EEQLEPLPGGQLPARVLALDGLEPSALRRPRLELAELLDPVLDRGLVAQRGNGRLPVALGGGRRARRVLDLCRFALLVFALGHSESPRTVQSIPPPDMLAGPPFYRARRLATLCAAGERGITWRSIHRPPYRP